MSTIRGSTYGFFQDSRRRVSTDPITFLVEHAEKLRKNFCRLSIIDLGTGLLSNVINVQKVNLIRLDRDFQEATVGLRLEHTRGGARQLEIPKDPSTCQPVEERRPERFICSHRDNLLSY